MIRYKIGPSLEDKKLDESIKIMKDSCEEILKQTDTDLENNLIDYINSMNNLAKATITLRLAAIKLFLKSNRYRLDWEHINSFKHSNKKKQKDEAYTGEQIENLLKFCNERISVIILIFASVGLRVGAIPLLKLKHLEKKTTMKGDIYQFTIYENEDQEYISFCTPECAFAIDMYLESRKRAGEHLTRESYLIRKEFDRSDIQQVKNRCEPVRDTTIRNTIQSLLVKTGIRQKSVGEYRNGFRHEIQMEHGFRKFFTSQCVNSNINTEKRYLLEGHALQNNDPSYIRIQKH